MLDDFRSTNITWDKATSRIYSPVTANESDENGRKLVVQIVNSGQVEDLTGATLHLYWETRDKLHDGLDVFKAVDLKNGEFELSYTTGMLSNKGVLNANLVLIDTVGRVVSERFKITVTEGIDNDAIQSENSFSSLTQALIDVSNLEQNYAPRLNDLTAQLQQKANLTDVANISTGTPLFTDTVLKMSDTSRLYVNTTDGLVYQYNSTNSAFESTGILYQSMGLDDKIVTPIKTSFIDVKNYKLIDLDTPLTQGYLDGDTGEFIPTTGAGNGQRTTGYIELETEISYTLDFYASSSTGTPVTYPRAVIIYNEDNSFSRGLPIPSGLNAIILAGTEKFIRVNYNAFEVTVFRLYPTDKGYEDFNTLQANVKVKRSSLPAEPIKPTHTFYGKSRKPIIGFILDGEYDMNADMENVFYSNGYLIGFAPQYTTNYPNNSVNTYLTWQDKGHEILAHGAYVMNEASTYTEDEAKAFIEAAYSDLTELGFDVNGYIGSSGVVADRYMKYVKSTFNYAATDSNRAGTDQASLYFGTNAPYKLFRYSMETSTLEQMKSAVDEAVATNALLLFYGHAKTTNTNNFTTENIQALCDYIDLKGCTVMPPYEAVKDYYSIRYDDIVTSP